MHKQKALSSAIFLTPILINGLLCFFLLIATCYYACAAIHYDQDEISEIFIEATGNNKYEAKIKAHAYGMRRALLLLADKFGIKQPEIKEIPYSKLKLSFAPIVIQNELSFVEKYSATVTYAYNKGELYKLLLEYGDSKIDDLFYEYLVIPVFKQGHLLNIWGEDPNWNNHWQNKRNILNNNKLLLLPKTLFLENRINQDNLFSLTYEDFIKSLPTALFKNVMIITAEYFTDRATNETIVRLTRHIIKNDHNAGQIIEEEHPLNNLGDIPNTVNLIINQIIDNYGMLRLNTKTTPELNLDKEPEEKKPIMMNFDVFDKEELDLVTSKLKNVKQISRFLIKHDYKARYKILIFTDSSEYELAEGLYANGLSYKIHGQLYNLIDIKKGG